MPDTKRERRSGRRLPVRVPVSIKTQPGKTQLDKTQPSETQPASIELGAVDASGFTRDLNRSGIFLYTDSRIVAGSELEMVLILPPELTHGVKQWVCCRASVVRVENNQDGGNFGVAASISSIEILPEIPA
jgi:hypothetical protein